MNSRRFINHLVGERKQLIRHIQAERFGSLEVDDHFKFDWCLDGEVGWLLAFENPIDVGSAAPEQVDRIDAVGHQAAVGGVEPEGIDGGQPVAGSQRKNPIALDRVDSCGQHDQASSRSLRERVNGRFEVVRRGVKKETRHLESKSRGHILNRAPYPSKSSETGVQNACHPPETGRYFFEQLQPFAADFRFESAEPGNVSSR
jgi:hypothetical protein